MKKILIIILYSTSFLFASEFDEWLKTQKKEYTNYKKSIDDEFLDMLKKDWEAFNTMYNPSPLNKPKPKIIPEIKKDLEIKDKDIKKSPIIKTKPIEVIKIPKQKTIKPIIFSKTDKNINIEFYGHNIIFSYDKNIEFDIKEFDKNIIGDYWSKISKTDYKPLLEEFSYIINSFNLNDWAKYLLISKIGDTIYKNKNSSKLFTWFILSKMGYDIKVGYNENEIYLLSTIAHKLYQVAYLKIDDKTYYILSPNGRISKVTNIYTYQGNYPNPMKKLSFEISKNIIINTDERTKKLSFEYKKRIYTINAKYSQDLIDFYKTFPQSDYKIYFDAKNSVEISNSLLIPLKEFINGKSELEAANFLLRFVQKSFKYKTDDEQFRYEKVMFPDETIYYEFSDCEDRSIIFSTLVKSLLGLDIVGVEFSGHLATAIAFSTQINGNNFNYKGKIYTIADPTYINANIGIIMPRYKNSKFKVIK